MTLLDIVLSPALWLSALLALIYGVLFYRLGGGLVGASWAATCWQAWSVSPWGTGRHRCCAWLAAHGRGAASVGHRLALWWR